MQQIIIDFTITSSESNQAFQTEGSMENHLLVFDDPTNHTHEIEIQDQRIVYRKTGETTLHLELDETSITNATYHIYEQTFYFQVHTHEISISNGFIQVQYALYQDGEEINQTQFTIRYKPLKEETS